MSLSKREKDEVIKRVARRLRELKAVGDPEVSKRIAAEELTLFYRERERGVIFWTQPTIVEKIYSKLFGR